MIRNLIDRLIIAITGPDDFNSPVYDIINGL